jgi:hypothetical protein
MSRHECNFYCEILELGDLKSLNFDSNSDTESDFDPSVKKDLDHNSGHAKTKNHPLRIGF